MANSTVASPPATQGRPGDGARPGNGARRWLGRHAEAYALLGLTFAAIIFFSVYGPTSSTFLTAGNFRTTASNTAVIAIVALAALVPLVWNAYDLSVGAVVSVSSVFGASIIASGSPVVVGFLAAILIGALIGVFNGLLVTRFRIDPIITTLAMSVILDGVVTWKTGGQAIVVGLPSSLGEFGASKVIGIPSLALIAIGIAFVVYYVLQHTPFGRYLYMLGSNPDAAGLVGLPTKRLMVLSFVGSGAIAAMAGLVQLLSSGTADPRIGDSYTLPALAGAFLSAAAIQPGRYNVWGTLVAIVFVAVLNSGLNLAGAAPYISSFVNGGALLIGVGLAVYLGRKRQTA